MLLLVYWCWLTSIWQMAAQGVNSCLQNFLQRVHNLFGYLMNVDVWCYMIEPVMDKNLW